jgi:hypothetical protein
LNEQDELSLYQLYRAFEEIIEIVWGSLVGETIVTIPNYQGAYLMLAAFVAALLMSLNFIIDL